MADLSSQGILGSLGVGGPGNSSLGSIDTLASLYAINPWDSGLKQQLNMGLASQNGNSMPIIMSNEDYYAQQAAKQQAQQNADMLDKIRQQVPDFDQRSQQDQQNIINNINSGKDAYLGSGMSGPQNNTFILGGIGSLLGNLGRGFSDTSAPITGQLGQAGRGIVAGLQGGLGDLGTFGTQAVAHGFDDLTNGGQAFDQINQGIHYKPISQILSEMGQSANDPNYKVQGAGSQIMQNTGIDPNNGSFMLGNTDIGKYILPFAQGAGNAGSDFLSNPLNYVPVGEIAGKAAISLPGAKGIVGGLLNKVSDFKTLQDAKNVTNPIVDATSTVAPDITNAANSAVDATDLLKNKFTPEGEQIFKQAGHNKNYSNIDNINQANKTADLFGTEIGNGQGISNASSGLINKGSDYLAQNLKATGTTVPVNDVLMSFRKNLIDEGIISPSYVSGTKQVDDAMNYFNNVLNPLKKAGEVNAGDVVSMGKKFSSKAQDYLNTTKDSTFNASIGRAMQKTTGDLNELAMNAAKDQLKGGKIYTPEQVIDTMKEMGMTPETNPKVYEALSNASSVQDVNDLLRNGYYNRDLGKTALSKFAKAKPQETLIPDSTSDVSQNGNKLSETLGHLAGVAFGSPMSKVYNGAKLIGGGLPEGLTDVLGGAGSAAMGAGKTVGGVAVNGTKALVNGVGQTGKAISANKFLDAKNSIGNILSGANSIGSDMTNSQNLLQGKLGGVTPQSGNINSQMQAGGNNLINNISQILNDPKATNAQISNQINSVLDSNRVQHDNMVLQYLKFGVPEGTAEMMANQKYPVVSGEERSQINQILQGLKAVDNVRSAFNGGQNGPILGDLGQIFGTYNNVIANAADGKHGLSKDQLPGITDIGSQGNQKLNNAQNNLKQQINDILSLHKV